MADDPLADAESVVEPSNTRVKVSLKAGPYEAPWINLDASNLQSMLSLFGDDLAKLMKETAEAQASFTRIWDHAKNQFVPKPGNYGKPEGASQSSGQEIPFADSADEDVSKCKHGDRTLIEANGKKGWVCPLPKGTDGRCQTEFV